MTVSSVSLRCWDSKIQLTLGKNDVVGVDELIEVVGLQLGDIRGRANSSGSQQAEHDLRDGMHLGMK